MPLEGADFITELKPLWPTALEPFSTADDHVRLIKTVLKNTFKNLKEPTHITGEEINAFPVFFSWDDVNKWQNIGFYQDEDNPADPPIPPTIRVYYPVYFLGYADLTSTNHNQFAILDKDTQIVKKMDGLGALGSIIWSILPPNIMIGPTTLWKDCFALCDGTNIYGSELWRETHIECAPNLIKGEALIMEETGAGLLQYELIADGALPTKFNYKTFNTSWKTINGVTDEVPHDHGGGLHKHYYDGMYNTSALGGPAPFEQFLNLNSGSVVVPVNLPVAYKQYPEGHFHTFHIHNLHPETTPPAIFLYPYIRVN